MKAYKSDVLVIGAGQAGLAAAFALSKAGMSFVIVDAHDAIGDSWRQRYDGLTLFTPRNISALPGTPLSGDPLGYGTKDEFADYLAQYASRYAHNVITGCRIVRLRSEDAGFVAEAADGSIFNTRAVIVATGAFQKPAIPAIAGKLSPMVRQLHVSEFRSAGSFSDGPVLVAGDGASGRDVAVALSSSHTTALSCGRARKLLPETILGQSIWWWLRISGLLKASPGSFIGSRMRKLDPFPARGNVDAGLRKREIELKPRLTGIDGESVVFADGSRMQPTTVVWATGYCEDFAWIEIDGATTADGKANQVVGISPVPGLFFVGRPWQRNRASALIFGADDDAAFVVEILSRRLAS